MNTRCRNCVNVPVWPCGMLYRKPFSLLPYTVPLPSTAGALMHHSKPVGVSFTHVSEPSGCWVHVCVLMFWNRHSGTRPAFSCVMKNGPCATPVFAHTISLMRSLPGLQYVPNSPSQWFS